MPRRSDNRVGIVAAPLCQVSGVERARVENGFTVALLRLPDGELWRLACDVAQQPHQIGCGDGSAVTRIQAAHSRRNKSAVEAFEPQRTRLGNGQQKSSSRG